jgi:hypothetical protein
MPSTIGPLKATTRTFQKNLIVFRWISFPAGVKRVVSKKKSPRISNGSRPGTTFLANSIRKYQSRTIIATKPASQITRTIQIQKTIFDTRGGGLGQRLFCGGTGVALTPVNIGNSGGTIPNQKATN